MGTHCQSGSTAVGTDGSVCFQSTRDDGRRKMEDLVGIVPTEQAMRYRPASIKERIPRR